MSVYSMRVLGLPAPQGSKRHVGRGILVESSKKVAPWREAIVSAAIRESLAGMRLDEPVDVRITFWFPRPKGHYATRGLRPTAPVWPAVKPDLDKVVRATLDGLVQANVLADDARIVTIHARKRYADIESPGALITVSTSDTADLE